MDGMVGYGVLSGFMPWASVGAVLLFLGLGFVGAPLWLWSLAGFLALWGFQAPAAVFLVFAVIAILFNVRPLRQWVASLPVMRTMVAMKLLPTISPTERTALEAGVVWMESELFSGSPDFKKMLSQPEAKLTEEEQSFIDNECEELCRLIDDYEIFRTKQIPTEVFEYIKNKGFLGLIIPKEYGGLGFSPAANSAVVQKVSSRSIGVVIYIMVPNSLGPAELLVHYGTQKQKDHYLPRLAKGVEIPCFGLTEPLAGSDAGSITSTGVLFKGDDGEIYMRLNWRKRWITLASISTIIGLAIRLRDPDNLLGRGEDVGITTALIPSDVKGVWIGKRHDPLGVPFHNCPTEGHDVVVKAEDAIIGGLAGAGHGWQMLMECLGAGRGISLPAQATGGAKLVSRLVSNHATIRKQFGVSIGKFEGVEEPISRIAGYAYTIESLRRYVLSALNQKISPPVITAIAKYNATEMARKAVNDGMDVLGGAGISMGPRNQVAVQYIGTPISITVEGANIMTRTFMIFGQGALRAHPFAYKEVNAVEKNDLKAFDQAFWGHIGHIFKNFVRSILLSVTRGWIATPPVTGPTMRAWQKLAWVSASFAILADIAMGLLGGKLKVKEKITGRFADILSWMLMITAILKRWETDGRKAEDLPLVNYSLKVGFHHIQEAFDGIYANFEVPILGWFFTGPVRWWSRLNMLSAMPSDRLSHKVSHALLSSAGVRDRLSEGVYLPLDREEAIGRLEHCYKVVKQVEEIELKVRQAVKSKRLPKMKGTKLFEEALRSQVITQAEFALLSEAEKLRADAVEVDEFFERDYVPLTHQPKTTNIVKPKETGGWAQS